MRKIIAISAGILLSLMLNAMHGEASGKGNGFLTGQFRTIPIGGKVISPAYSIAQDSDGFIWIGTDGGLVRHDGIRQDVFRWDPDDPLSLCNDQVNVIFNDPASGSLYVGTDIGLCTYDHAGHFIRNAGVGPRHVKSLMKSGGRIWTGTTDGLFSIDAETGETVQIMPSVHIASSFVDGDAMYFGGYSCIYVVRDGAPADTLRLGIDGGTDDNLVLAISENIADPGILLAGTEKGLVRFSLRAGKKVSVENFGSPVKNFSWLSPEVLVMGTDNGLYQFSAGGEMSLFRHQAGSVQTLPNNVIWCTFIDRDGNLWAGTDHGAALSRLSGDCDFVGLAGIDAAFSDGLDISSIECAADGTFWAAGMNGLIACRTPSGKPVYFKSDSGPSGLRLSHNKIRRLHYDGSALWIASDGGLDRYSDGRIRHFNVVEPSGKYRSSWMYDIVEDAAGRLWLGTYDGGIFIVSKDMDGSGGTVMADAHISAESGSPLSGNIVVRLVSTGDKVVAVTDKGVDEIDVRTLHVRRLPVPENKRALSLASNGGQIWIGTEAGVYALDPDGTMKLISGLSVSAQDMVYAGGRLWVMDGQEILQYDGEVSVWSHIRTFENQLLCMASDGRNVYAGCSDGFYSMPVDVKPHAASSPQAVITSLSLDNTLVGAGKEYSGNVILPEDICHMKAISLRHDQNSFALTFSSLEYFSGGRKYAYRLTGFHDEWQMAGEARAVFLNVPAGKYRFEVCNVNAEGPDESAVTSLDIRVRPVWYATAVAYVIYMMLIVMAGGMVMNFFKVRHQLKVEHVERDRALTAVKMKSDFLASMSHEFKSPLSIILNSVGRMISSEAGSIRSVELQAVRRNAEKMHMLIDKMMDSNGNDSAALFIPAAVSLQELAKEGFDGFAGAFRDKGINARFISDDIPYLFTVDRVQMAAVFNNLLSNALKFTPEGGTVLMGVKMADETSEMLYVDVSVEDTGCGIPHDELPYIFNQYYMASSGRAVNPEGTGIGLYLVKSIVERHKGRVTVTSEPGSGTCFTVRLSTMKAESFLLRHEDNVSYSLHNLSEVWHHERKPIILIVEDNKDVRELITASLGKDYVFVSADGGKEALEILDHGKADLVITDLVMPGMDGLSMIRNIRSSLKTAFLPVIVLSGAADGQTRLQCMENADAFIPKPFDMNYLNSVMIQLLIRHEQYMEKARARQMMAPDETSSVESADEMFLKKAVDIVNSHIDDPEFSASALCDGMRLPAKQVYRKLKQHTGLGAVEFIRDIRLQKAAALLSQDKLSVTEIMYMVGFTGASWFSRCFKAKYGQTPSEFAESHSADL